MILIRGWNGDRDNKLMSQCSSLLWAKTGGNWEDLQHTAKVVWPIFRRRSNNPCPGSSFLATFAGSWRLFTPPPRPQGLSRVLEHSDKIPTASPMFSGSNFLMVPLPVSRDVDFRQKSKMAVAKMKCTYFTAVIAEEQFLIFIQWANLSVHELKENKNDNTYITCGC